MIVFGCWHRTPFWLRLGGMPKFRRQRWRGRRVDRQDHWELEGWDYSGVAE